MPNIAVPLYQDMAEGTKESCEQVCTEYIHESPWYDLQQAWPMVKVECTALSTHSPWYGIQYDEGIVHRSISLSMIFSI